MSIGNLSPENGRIRLTAGAREPGANPGLARSGMGDGLDTGHWNTSGKASSSNDPKSENLPFFVESTV